MTDDSVFPHPVFRDTVLAPLFEGVKAHHAGAMDAINRAHLVMLCETGILGRDAGRTIARALAAIEAEVDVASLVYTGEHEDYFFLVEHMLKARVGPDLGGMLHTARSRNDMDHTAFRLALRDRLDALLAEALALAEAMQATATRHRDTLVVAYTHGQPAQPTTWGHYLCAALEILLEDIARLRAERERVDRSPMGAAAITTSGFPVDRGRMADLLGFGGLVLNSYGAIARADYVTGAYAAIRLMFVHLGRLLQDMQFWSAFEVGQLRAPDSLVQISSIMPQKRNPVPIEHARHLASLTAGRAGAMVELMHNTPFTDMNDSEGMPQEAGYAAFESGTRALQLLAALVERCTIDAERVARNADAACVTVTELADTLVRAEGLSFRQAHEIAAATARDAIGHARPLGQSFVGFAAAFAAHAGRPATLSEAGFAEAVSARGFVARRDRPGGPAPAAMDAALAAYCERLDAEAAAARGAAERIAAAQTTLDTAFARLMED